MVVTERRALSLLVIVIFVVHYLQSNDDFTASAHRALQNNDDFDDDEVLELDDKQRRRICPEELGMFTMVDGAVSFKVVNCFLGIIVFQVCSENILESLENAAHGTVYEAVLHKTYRELMLLGFVAFCIFFLLSDPSITDTFAASFEYADFCCFFLGMCFISQSAWACLANFGVKRIMWQACNTKAETLLAKRGWFSMSYVERHAIRIQLLRHIFLDTYNLPGEFNFAHYFSASLDALTGDLVEVLPSSYVFLVLLIIFVEYVVRHYPHDVDHVMHPAKRKSISEEKAIFLYGLIGFMIVGVYIYLLYVARRATYSIIKQHFARYFDSKGVRISQGGDDSKRLHGRYQRYISALMSTTVNGGYRRSRTLGRVWKDLMPFLQSSGDNVAAEMDRLRVLSTEIHETPSVARSMSRSRASTLKLRSAVRRITAVLPSTKKNSRAPNKVSMNEHNSFSDPSYDGDGEETAKGGRRRSRGISNSKRRTVMSMHLSATDKEKNLARKKREKRQRMAVLMTRHAARINTAYREGGQELARKLENDRTWINDTTEEINEVVRRNLPGHSIKGIRTFIDALRLISNFYVAIFICTFITGSHIAENMTPLERSGNLFGLMTVIIANTVIDPMLTFEYATIRTVGVINPLLVANTVQHARNIGMLMRQIAAVALRRHRISVDSLFNVQANAVSADLIRIILWGLFEEWDVNSIGYLTPATFQRACRISDISWGSKQSSEVFNLLDCYKYDGKVNFDEFFATMAPFVSSLVDEIQGHPPDDEDFTANLTNMAELLDEAHSRRETHLALERDNRGDSYSDSSFEDGDEDEDKIYNSSKVQQRHDTQKSQKNVKGLKTKTPKDARVTKPDEVAETRLRAFMSSSLAGTSV